MKINRFEELECWQEARKLTNMVFDLTSQRQFNSRGFRLTDQMTGAAISVMNNIVEGFDSQSNPEFMKFLGYSRRSASELQTCLYVAVDNRLISQSQFDAAYEQAENTRKLIDGFRRYLRNYQLTQRANRLTGQRAQRIHA